MSNSSLVTYTRISPNKTSPRNHKIDTISIHCVVGQLTAKQVLNLPHFVNYDPVGGASCNYCIGKDGSIGLGVDENDRSWCTSNGANDNRAITIEVASDTTHPYAITDAAYKALIDLCVDICERNNIDGLKWEGNPTLIGQIDRQNMTVHRWFANKACPGDYLFNLHGQIASEVNSRLNIKSENKNNDLPAKSNVKVGDIVSLSKDAIYYDGKSIPTWVKDRRWIVRDVKDDRVVIDKSVDGKNSICSPVNAKYLSVISIMPNDEDEGTVGNIVPFLVKVNISNLNIRRGPGTNYDRTGKFTGIGVFTIVDIKDGIGSDKGWGKLKSGEGWISLDYAELK